MNKFAILLALSSASVLSAAPKEPVVTLDYDQATNLYTAIAGIQAGLEVDNVAALADDINLLSPFVKKYDTVKESVARHEALLQVGEDAKKNEKMVNEEASRIDFGHRLDVKVALKIVHLTSDEIKTAKITPAVLAQIRQYLSQ